MAQALALLVVAAAVAVASAGNIPDYIHVCKRNNPNLDKCIKDSIESLRPVLLKGIPELEVPPLEPLLLSEVVVAHSVGNNRFRAVGHDVKVYGPGSFTIDDLKANLKDYTFTAKISIPTLYFEALYDVDAQLLNVPLKGTGPLQANTTDCTGEVVLKGQLIKKDGAVYLYFYNIQVTIDVKHANVHLEGLFNGDKVLGEATNRALNDNQSDFWPTVKPIAEKTIGEVMLGIANKITSHFTYPELFPKE